MNYAELVLAGHIAWFELLASAGVPSRRTKGALAVMAGTSSNVDNGVAADPATIDIEAFEGVLRWLRSSALPASCVLGSRPRAARVAQLAALGLRVDNNANVMGRSLSGYEPPAAKANGYDIREVSTGEDLADGMAALGEDWFDAKERRQRSRVYEAIGLGEMSRVRHWVARQDGRAVAMATMFRFDDVVELAQCGVAAAHRRRGIARALTGARLRAAIGDGTSAAVLSPSQDGYLLHRQLGFTLLPALRHRWFHVAVDKPQ